MTQSRIADKLGISQMRAARLTDRFRMRSVWRLVVGDLPRQGPGAHRGDHVGPSPVDRGRPGSKHHVIVDRQGIPLAVSLTGGNRHDVMQLIPLLDAIPRTGGPRGRPRNRPKRMFADRGYDFDKYRRLLWKRGIKPLIAR